MKLRTILRTSLVLFFIFGWLSCDKKTEQALSLHQIEHNALQLYYGSKGGVTITGGDGAYSFLCESSLLKAEMTHSNYIQFEPTGVGEASVTIRDSSGESLLLHVTIVYKTKHVVISGLDATVAGDAMTVAEQKKLKAEALATIPVKTGGGYRFVYNGGEERAETEGTVFIYPETYGQDGIEGTFKETVVGNDSRNVAITLYYSDTERTFVFREYEEPAVRSSPREYRAVQFAEDLTEQYQTAYPNVEQVYTSQVIGSMTTE
ncbi:MAG: hypothetical protein LBP50_05190 [Tannerella sp.]|jgi:hypothetical protein|nr:hypothetical protein [Tannerella sp.]